MIETQATWKNYPRLWDFAIHTFKATAKANNKEYQIQSAEVLSGILRAAHHYIAIEKSPYGDSMTIPQFVKHLEREVGNVALRSFRNCPNESDASWCSGLRFGLYNADPRHTAWMTQPLLKVAMANFQTIDELLNRGQNTGFVCVLFLFFFL